nr:MULTISPECIES: hypothetical protein [unclassified Roseburia]
MILGQSGAGKSTVVRSDDR